MLQNSNNIFDFKILKGLLFSSDDPVVIDIGASSIKIVELNNKDTRKEEWNLKRYKIIDIPRDTIMEISKEMPEDFDFLNEKVLREIIEKIVNSYYLKNRNAIIVISSVLITSNWINITVKEDENMNAIFMEKLGAFLPQDIGNYYIDFKVLDDKKENKVILSEAILKDVLLKIVEIMQDTGLNPIVVDSSDISVMNMFHYYVSKADNEKKNIAIVNIGHKGTMIMIFKGSRLRSLRRLPIGGESFTKNIMDAKGLTYRDAERFKREEMFFFNNMDEQNRNDNYLIIKSVFGRLIKDMYDSFDHYLAKHREFKIHEIILCGGGANFENMPLLINKHLNIKTYTSADIFNIKYNENEILNNEKNIIIPAVSALLR